MEMLMSHMSEKAGFNIADMPAKILEFQQGAQQVVQHFDTQMKALAQQLVDVQQRLVDVQEQLAAMRQPAEEAHKGKK
jgi:hypothetical protein